MTRLCDTDAYKRLLRQQEDERDRVLRAAWLLGVDQPQRRSTESLRRAIRHRINEAKKVL